MSLLFIDINNVVEAANDIDQVLMLKRMDVPISQLAVKNMANTLREAGRVLLKEKYESLAEQIDALLVNYGFQGLACEICGDELLAELEMMDNIKGTGV